MRARTVCSPPSVRLLDVHGRQDAEFTDRVGDGKSLRFRYRLIIHPGDAASANIPAEWDKYVKGK